MLRFILIVGGGLIALFGLTTPYITADSRLGLFIFGCLLFGAGNACR